MCDTKDSMSVTINIRYKFLKNTEITEKNFKIAGILTENLSVYFLTCT